eukprot:CAMPEP_0117540318 /NCGR_PEP_ID=MMETSP0784-20121206/43438_1 /TAXON_ID=39447 /ORGANISM="" /LENGTH=228 /DNA_ID=CAMNT_0005336971 /DNA_START=69 /DNA_END=752 /DNA_ORIENTATION=+
MKLLKETPCWDGVSQVWCSPRGALLVLGNTSNALAAAASAYLTLPLRITHIVSVGQRRRARLVHSALSQSGLGVAHRALEMLDRMAAGDDVPIDTQWAPLALLHKAFQECEAEGEAKTKAQSAGTGPLAVLVHCDMGHNRSPALVLTFLLTRGLSLRGAYRQLLRARPTVDPLPPYRRALRRFEVELRGNCSVGGEEPWAMHLSELMALEACTSEETDFDCFDRVIQS